jgi:hypothetical protein
MNSKVRKVRYAYGSQWPSCAWNRILDRDRPVGAQSHRTRRRTGTTWRAAVVLDLGPVTASRGNVCKLNSACLFARKLIRSKNFSAASGAQRPVRPTAVTMGRGTANPARSVRVIISPDGYIVTKTT